MRELLGDLGFRHTKEEGLESAARVPGTPSRRLGKNPRGAVAAMVVGAKLGFEERYLCRLGGSPAPPYIGGGAGRPRGGRGVPPQLGLEGAPPVGGGNSSPTRFAPSFLFPSLSCFSRLTFKLDI